MNLKTFLIIAVVLGGIGYFFFKEDPKQKAAMEAFAGEVREMAYLLEHCGEDIAMYCREHNGNVDASYACLDEHERSLSKKCQAAIAE
ncbi:MAG: hypothetical protein KDK65_07840 [Chlamydiia bacterium]|nr:hypothetical protein [Chlamydiia bacterium]